MGNHTTTYSVATMQVPAGMHRAIQRRLEEAGYQHAIGDNGLLDLSGIALEPNIQTHAWWAYSEWHPATLESAIEHMEEMRDDWAALGRLLGFERYADPEAMFAAVTNLANAGAPHPLAMVRLDLRQQQIAEMASFAGEPVPGTAMEDQDVLRLVYEAEGHSGAGLYISYDELPEAGAMFLGEPVDMEVSKRQPFTGISNVTPEEMAVLIELAKQPGQLVILPAESERIERVPHDARRLRQLLGKASFSAAADRHSALDHLANLEAVASLQQQLLDQLGVDDQHAAVKRIAELERAIIFKESDQAELTRLRLKLETLERNLVEAQRVLWTLVRSAPGGSIRVQQDMLARQEWGDLGLQVITELDGSRTWVAKVHGQPQPPIQASESADVARLHDAIEAIDDECGNGKPNFGRVVLLAANAGELSRALRQDKAVKS